MLDLKYLRDHLDAVKQGVESKNVKIDFDRLIQLDEERRELTTQLDDLRSQKNKANDQIGKLVAQGKDPKDAVAEVKKQTQGIDAQIDELAPKVKQLKEELDELLATIPNIPHDSVPVGGESANEEVEQWGEKPSFDFKPKDHIELAEALDIVDFKRGAKISGSNFILYKKQGAKLVRALLNFMLDVHTEDHGYQEMFTPVLVNAASMYGTGQLPKMKEDMYHVTEDDLYLIPTAEVPVTNIHRDDTLDFNELPLKYTAYSSCFRREAGSYGKDTRGLIRVHQFDKVELVKFVRPEESYQELESLRAEAQEILKRLNLPYRVLKLASGDLSFAAAKCYDLEVYSSGMDKWLECSSCSNFEDFQARRANIRFKDPETKKTTYVHTLNGSGLALPRIIIAILENYQNQDGSIQIPEALRPYMGIDEIRNA